MTTGRVGFGVVTGGLVLMKRAMYRGGRPNAIMRLWNRVDAVVYASRLLAPSHAAVLQVVGRRSGCVTRVPVAVAECDGSEFLVSMLGPDVNWVRNVEAAGGRAVLRRGGRGAPIVLELVHCAKRAPVLRRYLAIAPGARPHLGLTSLASMAELSRIAAGHPVFRIVGERP